MYGEETLNRVRDRQDVRNLRRAVSSHVDEKKASTVRSAVILPSFFFSDVSSSPACAFLLPLSLSLSLLYFRSDSLRPLFSREQFEKHNTRVVLLLLLYLLTATLSLSLSLFFQSTDLFLLFLLHSPHLLRNQSKPERGALPPARLFFSSTVSLDEKKIWRQKATSLPFFHAPPQRGG